MPQSGQDYADQRYFNATLGRFWTPDPSAGSNPANPASWNKYAYVGGAPINFKDPAGLCMIQGDDPEGTADQCGPWSEVPGGPVKPDFEQPNPETEPSNLDSIQGTGDVMAVLKLTHSSAIDDAWAGIRAAFANGSDCANWFNAGLMTSTNHVYGSIDNFLGNIIPMLSGAGTFVGGNGNAIATSPLTTPVLIAVNTNGALFHALAPGTSLSPSDDFADQFAAVNGNSDRARVFILLHELGHVLEMIRSNDSGQSSQAQANQRYNNDEIWRNCSGTINSFSNTAH